MWEEGRGWQAELWGFLMAIGALVGGQYGPKSVQNSVCFFCYQVD